MKSNCLWLAACVMIAAGAHALAQDNSLPHLSVSAGWGYERSFIEDTFVFPMVTATGVSKKAEQGTAVGYDIRAGVSYEITQAFGLSTRIEWNHLGASFDRYFPNDEFLIDPPLFYIPLDQGVVREHIFTMEEFRLDLLARYTIPHTGLGIAAGATAAKRKFTWVKIATVLLEPQNARFKNPEGIPTENNGRTLLYYDGTWPESNHSVLGALAELSWTIPAFEGFAVVPEVIVRKEFTPPIEGSAWPSLYISPGLSISYGF